MFKPPPLGEMGMADILPPIRAGEVNIWQNAPALKTSATLQKVEVWGGPLKVEGGRCEKPPLVFAAE